MCSSTKHFFKVSILLNNNKDFVIITERKCLNNKLIFRYLRHSKSIHFIIYVRFWSFCGVDVARRSANACHPILVIDGRGGGGGGVRTVKVNGGAGGSNVFGVFAHNKQVTNALCTGCYYFSHC